MKYLINDEASMKYMGERLGRQLHGGECIELIGDVGAGKTTLTKGIAIGLGITDTVQSPTFTINRTYQARDGLQLSHYDFYRLHDAGIMAEELAEALEDDERVIVIEWGEIVADILPSDTLRITIESPDVASRTLTLQARGIRADRVLKGLSS